MIHGARSMWRHLPNALRSPSAWLLCRLRRSQKSNYSKTTVRLALKFYGATYPGPNRCASCIVHLKQPRGAIPRKLLLFIWSKWMLRGSLYDYECAGSLGARSKTMRFYLFSHHFCTLEREMDVQTAGRLWRSTSTNDRVNSEFNWCWFNNKAK